MIRLLLTLTLCVLVSLASFAQSHVIYIRPDGSKTLSPDSANSYIMYEPVADSLWSMRQFSMDHMIMTSGYYADEAMTTPHGKFTYYQYFSGGQRVTYDFEKRKYDTIKYEASNYISKSGYFVNGKRNGKWEVYNMHGKIYQICFYRDDKLSGLMREYDDDGKQILEEGFMKDDYRDGNWSFYTPKGALMGTIRYYKGEKQGINSKLTGKALSVRRGMPDYDLGAYLTGALRNRKLDHKGNCGLTYMMHLNTDGTLSKPETLRTGCDIELEVAIGEILMNAPAWDIAKKDGKPVEATAVIFLQIRFDADKKPRVILSSDQTDSIWLFSTAF